MGINIPLYNIFKALQSDVQSINVPTVKRELIPPPSLSLKPHSGRSIATVVNTEKLNFNALNKKERQFVNKINNQQYTWSDGDIETAQHLVEKLMEKDWNSRSLIGVFTTEKMSNIWNKERVADGGKPYDEESPKDIAEKLMSKIAQGIKPKVLEQVEIETKQTEIEKAVGKPSEEVVEVEKENKEISQKLWTEIEKIKEKKKEYTMENFKEDLEVWKSKNTSSKLCKETQIVYFVGKHKVYNFEDFAAKLTRNTGAILESGGTFKMRSGLKKEILGMDKEVAKEIIATVTKGGVGPFFLPMACNTGSKTCNCN